MYPYSYILLIFLIVLSFMQWNVSAFSRMKFLSQENVFSSYNQYKRSVQLRAGKKITPNEGESMDEYRKAVIGVLNEYKKPGKFGGRDLLEMLVKKWGAAYDIQLRKNAPFGEASGNIYVNVMWRYFGQKSFPMSEREYLEHLEAICRYIVAVDRVDMFKEKVAESRKRPNGYFGYAVSFSLDVPPDSADEFFKDLPYE